VAGVEETDILDEIAEANAPAPDPAEKPSVNKINAMMDAAAGKVSEKAESVEDKHEEAAAEPAKRPAPSQNLWHVLSFVLIWTGVALAVGALLLVLFSPQLGSSAGWVLTGGVALVAALFIAGGMLKVFSPLLLTGAVLRQVSGKRPQDAAQLAGSDMLSALNLAEKILDTDDATDYAP